MANDYDGSIMTEWEKKLEYKEVKLIDKRN